MNWHPASPEKLCKPGPETFQEATTEVPEAALLAQEWQQEWVMGLVSQEAPRAGLRRPDLPALAG